MRRILALFMSMVWVSSGTTLEVLRVYQPLSFHGTDVDYEFEGRPIQARVLSRPMVLSGAMPENLVAAVGKGHQMPAMSNYDVAECNLLKLYGLEISGEMTEGKGLLVTIDLRAAKVPEGVELPIRTVLKLSIDALKRTLNDYHHAENGPLKVSLSIVGVSEKNASLRDLSGRFEVAGQ